MKEIQQFHHLLKHLQLSLLPYTTKLAYYFITFPGNRKLVFVEGKIHYSLQKLSIILT